MRAAVSGRAVTGHDPRARRSSGIVARTSLDLRLVPLDVPGVQVYSTYMARHPLHEPETTLLERTNIVTGTRVALVYDYAADADQPWETICVDHGTVCSHETRRLAEGWLSHPEAWCEVCSP